MIREEVKTIPYLGIGNVRGFRRRYAGSFAGCASQLSRFYGYWILEQTVSSHKMFAKPFMANKPCSSRTLLALDNIK